MEMKYYNHLTKNGFLDYVESHSITERALFNREQVAQVLDLAGYHERAEEVALYTQKWYSVDLSEFVEAARKRSALKI